MTAFYPKNYFYIGGLSDSNTNRPILESRLIDFATQSLTTSDSAHMLAVPAGTMVMFANYQTITTVAGSTSQFVISGTTTGAYVATAVAVAAGAYGVPIASAITNTNVVYASNDNIDIKTVTVASLTAGQIKVFALMVNLMPPSYVDVDGVTKTYTYTDRNSWQATLPVIP